jgi:hypothetical protein
MIGHTVDLEQLAIVFVITAFASHFCVKVADVGEAATRDVTKGTGCLATTIPPLVLIKVRIVHRTVQYIPGAPGEARMAGHTPHLITA